MASKRTDVFLSALVILIFYASFIVRKPSFQQPDGISLTLYVEDMCRYDESFIYSSLFCYRKVFPNVRTSRKTLTLILLLMCGDVESCPGPESNDCMKTITSMRGIKLFHQNIRSLFHNFTNLSVIFERYKGIDIMTLSETHITSDTFNDDDTLYQIPGYNFIKRNRQTGPGGGVAIYISADLNWKRRDDLEHDEVECIWIEIFQEKSKSFILGCMYRPPASSEYLSKYFTEVLDKMLMTLTELSKEVILLGDLNSDFLKRNECKHLKDITTLYGFKQIISKPTRVTETSSTLIDVILSNNDSSIVKNDVIPFSLSDHDMVGCVRKINYHKFNPRTVRCRKYRDYDPDKLCSDLSAQNYEHIYQMKDVNKAWMYLKRILTSTFNRHAPIILKRVKGRHCPWLTPEIKQHMNRRDQILRKARKSNIKSDMLSYKALRNYCNILIRNAKSNYHKNLINENKNNPRMFWKSIKSVFPNNKGSSVNNSSIPFLESDCDTNYTSKANIFCHFFSTVAKKLKEISIPMTNFTWRKPIEIASRTNKKFNFKYVSKLFVEKQLNSLKRNKASGLDDLPPGLLKDAARVISKPLNHIINLSLQTGIIPSDWKVAKVTPIYKSGAKTKTDNYRPISILPILSKILEKAVQLQITEYLEENKLLSDKQFGYRKKRSTELATTLFIDDIRKEIDQGKMTGAVFIDLSKAFDTLGHSTLISKLKSYGLSKEAINWFADYLFQRYQVVSYDGEKSNSFPVTCGVPQGSILGPTLFMVYFNDLQDYLNHSKVIKFADDTVVYHSSKCFNVIQDNLNSDLKSLSNYFMDNELIINLKKNKTEAMLFGTAIRLSKNPDKLCLFYKDHPITFSKSYKYLGTTVDPCLNLHDNFDSLYKRASSKLNLLAKLKINLTGDAVKQVYEAVILPGIKYNCITNLNITNTQKKKLTSLDNRAKQILNCETISINTLITKHAVLLVKKCVDGNICSNFQNYFEKHHHVKTTRNNTFFLKIPKVKLECSKNSFYFMGVKIFNSLPIETRKTLDFNEFKKKLENTVF